MRSIPIDEKIKGFAADYMKDVSIVVPDAKEKLERLARFLGLHTTEIYELKAKKLKIIPSNGQYFSKISEYVATIADRYDEINEMLPSQCCELITQMEGFLGKYKVEDIWVKEHRETWDRNEGRDRRAPLWELIVKAMGYHEVRKEVFPNYVKKLDIKSCVYCNAQFAVTTLIEEVHDRIKKGSRGRPKEARVIPLMGGYYELDHNKPKSRYPYLCTNFYNLQPCCSSCNKRKSDHDISFSLYREGEFDEEESLHFAIPHQAIIDFHTQGKCKGVVAHLCDDGSMDAVEPYYDGTLAARFNHYFDIDKLYAELDDEVEELLWRNRIYTKGLVNATNTQYSQLGIEDFDFERYILGTYVNKDEVFKRPLTKMKQDIWEQLKGK